MSNMAEKDTSQSQLCRLLQRRVLDFLKLLLDLHHLAVNWHPHVAALFIHVPVVAVVFVCVDVVVLHISGHISFTRRLAQHKLFSVFWLLRASRN